MTPTECVDLVEFVAGRCPAMRMQPNTPETWYVDLVPFDLRDAVEAARRVSIDKTFIGIGDLVRECEAIVRKRAGEERRAQLDAEIAAENPGELQPRPVRAAIESVAPRRGFSRWPRNGATVPRTEKPPFTAEELAAAREAFAGLTNSREQEKQR